VQFKDTNINRPTKHFTITVHDLVDKSLYSAFDTTTNSTVFCSH